MEWEVSVVDRRGRSTTMIVAADERATVGDLRDALARTLRHAVRSEAVWIGDRRFDDTVSLIDIGLTTGAVLSCGRLGSASPHAPSGPELAVVGGLAAGSRILLRTQGPLAIGRTGSVDLALDDPEVSRRHAEVAASGDGALATVTDSGSRNGTIRRGLRLAGPAALGPGDVIQVGETVLAVRPVLTADAHTSVSAAHGVVWFNRPPRIRPPAQLPEVTVPAKPEKPRGFRFPLAMVLLPILAAGLLFLVLRGQPYFLIFLALSPLMAIGHYLTERRGGRKEYRDKERGYRAELAAAQARLAEIAAEEELAAREAMPDPAALAAIAAGPTGRLFERRASDPDFLRLRVGLTDRPSEVHLIGPGAVGEQPRTAYAVPVAVDLAGAGVLGIAGPRRATLPIARLLLTQAAALHAPHDLGIVLLTGSDESAEWEWLSWLPHTLPHRPDLACQRLFATDLAQAEARVAELRRCVDERRLEQRARLREAVTGRRLLMVLDGARRFRDLTGLPDLLAGGPEAGVYALCLDTAELNLPDECRATVVVTSRSGTRVRVSGPGHGPDRDVLADGVPPRLAAEVARALAPMRVLGARFGDDEGLPDQVRFLELAGLGPDPTPEQVAEGWAAAPGGRSTRAMIGAGPNGPVDVDLRRDGPHALVAGTSGAGKSELLQTLVASLALANPPDALCLVLVDYKGGSAFADCQDLPHCVGLVTDLDGHLVNRALASLSAELRRREAILAGAGAKDIEDYWATTGGRLPRLVIVVDEFASLVEEVPEFVTGVVGIGMRGRSLGVHVVLATQRPGGVVNAELRANLNLRVCLRVTSTSESSDVIDVPDAARISRHHPGRAHLRTGHSDLALIQCARIGWPRKPVAAAEPGDPVTVRPRRMADLGRTDRTGQTELEPGHDGDTDLTALVSAIRAAADRLELHPPARPWLPPLPERVLVDQLDVIDPAAAASPVTVPLGLADHPGQQAQTPYAVDLDQVSPVVVAGMSRSGRSTTLRTLAAALAARTSPADVHIYALDYGGRALAPLAGLPHCGAWVGADEADRAERLLAMLTAEIARRQRLLGDLGYASLREQRAAAAPTERIPYLVFLIDQYGAFLDRYAETDGGRLVDLVDGLLRRGPAVGILPVLTTDRSGFGQRIASAVPTRLVLRQAEPDHVSAYGLHPRDVPRRMPPGRALLVPDTVELQVALLDPDPDGAAQATAVERLAERLTSRWDGLDPALIPRRVDPLPTSITTAELATLRRSAPPSAPATCTVGAGGDHLGPLDVDLADAGSAFLISGPPRSGRSSALMAMVASLAGRASGDLPVVAVCPRQSPVSRFAGIPGLAAVVTGTALADDLQNVLAELAGPVALAIDDAELLGDSPASDLLEIRTRTARDQGSLVVAAGTTDDLLGQRYRGWLAAVRRTRCGLLLNPSSYMDGEVFDLKLPRSTGGGWPPGRALLVWRGTTTPIQVPALPEPVDHYPDESPRARADVI